MVIDVAYLRAAVLEERYEVSQHAEQGRLNDTLLIQDVENAILSGEIIESYPDDARGPSCLICGTSVSRLPVHVVVGFLPSGWLRVITVYVPSPDYLGR